jgi:chorismate dehydratase
MTLTIGHITYANCAPFFHYLPAAGFSGKIVPGVPSRLNQMLAGGELDASPSSSFEYARNWQEYLLLPGHSISAFGPVKSVLLFSPRPLEELRGAEIALTGESATSVNLMRILLKEFLGHGEVNCRVPERPVEELLAEGSPALLIGDRALKASLEKVEGRCVYDLGELWQRYTGLPFVFALWILRRQSALEKRGEVIDLLAQLAESRRRAFASLKKLASESPERQWMGEEGLADYWRCMSYELTEDHIAGLQLFFRLSVKHGLLDQMPEIRFFE